MTSIKTASLVAVSLCLLEARADEVADRRRCQNVHGQLETTLNPVGCESPIGLCTEGQLTKAGLLNGTTRFVAMSATSVAGEVASLAYTGTLTVTTRHGVIVFTDVGVFDAMNLLYSEIDRATSGTGRWEGVTGTLFFSGPAYDGGARFGGGFSGELCTR